MTERSVGTTTELVVDVRDGAAPTLSFAGDGQTVELEAPRSRPPSVVESLFHLENLLRAELAENGSGTERAHSLARAADTLELAAYRELDTSIRAALVRPIPVGLPDPTTAHLESCPDPYVPRALVRQTDGLRAFLVERLGGVEFELGVVEVLGGGAAVAPYLPQWVVRRQCELDAFLADRLTGGVAVRLADPALRGSGSPDPYVPRAVVRRAAGLRSFLLERLGCVAFGVGGTGDRVAGAVVEPYVPRWVLRRQLELGAFLADRLPGDWSAGLKDSAVVGRASVEVDPTDEHSAERASSPDENDSVECPVVSPAPATSPFGSSGRLLTRLPDGQPADSLALERTLRAELDVVTLVGEVDHDQYAEQIETALRTAVTSLSIEQIVRTYPATFATYMVREALVHAEGRLVFGNLSIPELRVGTQVGPASYDALRRLGKSVFEDIERLEGIGLTSRYVRRLQMHGGIPKSSVPKVMTNLVATLRSGASTGQEVAQDWLSDPLLGHAVGVAVRRILTYTDYGLQLLDALVELTRLDRQGVRPTSVAPLPAYLLTAAITWLAETGPGESAVWGSRTRPQVRLARGLGDGPVLSIPETTTRWSIGGTVIAYGSETQEQLVPLPFHPSGRWEVQGAKDDGRGAPTVDLRSAAPDAVVLVFDERGRYHHHTLTLGGVRAEVIAPRGSIVPGEVDRTPLIGPWVGFDRIDCQVAGLPALNITTPGGMTVRVTLDADLSVELSGESLRNCVGPGGAVVLNGPPRLVFTKFVPAPGDVLLTIDDATGQRCVHLDDPSILEESGSFALGQLFDPSVAGAAELRVERDGLKPTTLRFVRAAGLRLGALPLTDIGDTLTLQPELLPGWSINPAAPVVPAGQREATLEVTGPGGSSASITVKVPRLEWDAYRDDQRVMLNSSRLRLGLDELSRLRLKVKTGVETWIEPTLVSPHGSTLQKLPPVLTNGRYAVTDVPLGQFVDTANLASNDHPRARLDIRSFGDTVQIGEIEARYVPDDLRVDMELNDDDISLLLVWTDFRPTTDRCVRVWNPTTRSLVATSPVPDGLTSHLLTFASTDDCTSLIVQVAVDDEWGGAPTFPRDSNAVQVALDDDAIHELTQHIEAGAPIVLSDRGFERLLPIVAGYHRKFPDVKTIPRTREWRTRELISESGSRVLAAATQLAEGVDECAPIYELDRLLFSLLLPAFDSPLQLATPVEDLRLERLWQAAPVLAAALDRFGHPDAPEATARWERFTGTSVGSAVSPSAVFEGLVRPVDRVISLSGTGLGQSPDGAPLLTADGWAHAAASERAGLMAWHATNARRVDGWFERHREFRNIRPLWSRAEPGSSGHALLHLLSTSLMALNSGLHSDVALERFEEAIGRAPKLCRSAMVFAIAYARIHADHPELRALRTTIGRVS